MGGGREGGGKGAVGGLGVLRGERRGGGGRGRGGGGDGGGLVRLGGGERLSEGGGWVERCGGRMN